MTTRASPGSPRFDYYVEIHAFGRLRAAHVLATTPEEAIREVGRAVGLSVVARRSSSAAHHPDAGDRVVVRTSDGREWIGVFAGETEEHWTLRGVNSFGLRNAPLEIERHTITHWRHADPSLHFASAEWTPVGQSPALPDTSTSR